MRNNLHILFLFLLCAPFSLAAQDTTTIPPAKQEATPPLPVKQEIPPPQPRTPEKGLASLTDFTSIMNYGIPDRFPHPLPVNVTFLLNSIDKINEADNSYIASLDITLSWQDSALAFNPTEYGTFRRELIADQAVKFLARNWSPDITISNMRGAPMPHDRCILITADGHVTYIQRIKAIFINTYELLAFPFDRQNLVFKLISNRYNETEVVFSQNQTNIDQSGIREDFSLNGWTLQGIDYKLGSYRGLDGRFFSQFLITTKIIRKPISHLFTLSPLLLVIIVPTILTLYAQVDTGARLSNWSGAILALIALSFTMQLRYPTLPSNSIVNQSVGLLFSYEFLMIWLTMTIFNPQIKKKIKNPYLIPLTDTFMKWQLPLTLLVIILFIIFLAIAHS